MEKEPMLMQRLRLDESLKADQERLEYFLAMSHIYLQDLEDNLQKNIFDLSEATSMQYDEWFEFLNHPVVMKFRDEMILSMSHSHVASSMMTGTDQKKALDSFQRIRGMGSVNDRSTYIYTRLPIKKSILDEEEEYMEVL